MLIVFKDFHTKYSLILLFFVIPYDVSAERIKSQLGSNLTPRKQKPLLTYVNRKIYANSL